MATNRAGSHVHKALSFMAIGFLLFGLLGACTKLNVQVDTCGRVSPGPGPEPPPAGGCNTPAPITQNTAATSLNAYNAATKQKITDSSLMCLAGGVSSTGGNCGFTPCRTWYYSQSATTGNCTATCNP